MNCETERSIIQNSNNSWLFSKMVAKMAAENMNLIYISSASRYKDRWSVQSYEVDDEEFGHVEINNDNCSFCKMVGIGGRDSR